MKVVIQHVPGRHEAEVAAIKDIFSEAIVVDHQKGDSAMTTFRRSINRKEPHWHFEDDVVLAPDFVERATGLLRRRSQTIINGFSQTLREGGMRPGSQFSACPCIWFPAGIGSKISDFFYYWERREESEQGKIRGYYDGLIMSYLIKTKTRYWQEVPSLVQHVGKKSTLEPRSSRQISQTYKAQYEQE